MKQFNLVLLIILFVVPALAQKPELVVQMGHKEVTAIAISNDGRLFATGGEEATVKLWDFASRKELRTWRGHTGAVNDVEFSPDGKWVVSSGSGEVRFWDTATGKAGPVLNGSAQSVNVGGYLAMGGSLFTTINDKGVVQVLQMPEGKRIASLKSDGGGSFMSVAVSHDGQFIGAGNSSGEVHVWRREGEQIIDLHVFQLDKPTTPKVASQDPLSFLEGETDFVCAVAFSRDGKLVAASASSSGSIWEVESGKTIRKIGAIAKKLIFSPNGSRLVDVGDEIKTWEVQGSKPARPIVRPIVPVRSQDDTAEYWPKTAALTPDGKSLVVGGSDGSLRWWDIDTAKEYASLERLGDAVRSLFYDPEQVQLLWLGNEFNVWRWDLNASGVGKKLDLGILQTVSFSAKRYVQVVRTPPGPGTYAHEGLLVRELQSGREVATIPSLSDEMALSPDGSRLAIGDSAAIGKQDVIYLWDVRTKQLIRTFSRDSTGEDFFDFNSHVNSLEFSSDGRRLLTAGRDGFLRVWNVETGTIERNIAPGADLGSRFTRACFNPDGKRIAASRGNGTVLLLNAATGIELHMLPLNNPVTSMTYLSGLPILAVGSEDGFVSLFHTETGQLLGRLYTFAQGDWAVVGSDSRFDASPGAMKLLHFVVGLDLVELAQLKDRYYEPGLLSRLLGFNKEPLQNAGVLR